MLTDSKRPLLWLGTSRKDVRRFPALVRRLIGFQLCRLQQGLDPNDWKPMTGVGPGVREIRIHAAGAHRIFYVTTRPEGVYVLHAFEKKTQKTSAADISLGQERYRGLQKVRHRNEGESES